MAGSPHAATVDRAPRASFSSMLERAWLRRGALAFALWPLSWLYIGVSAVRRALFRIGVMSSVRLPVKVIVVGNLIAGGAGKTPTVLAVVALLQRRGFKPGIVSRGYGRSGNAVTAVDASATAASVGDEPIVLHRRSGVPVVVGTDRVRAAAALLHRHPSVDVIVSDDGLQHLRLQRDAAVLVFDERGIGNGWRLPAGPLREAFTARPPARSVVLYNGERQSTVWPGHHGVRHLRAPIALRDWHRAGDATTWAARSASTGTAHIDHDAPAAIGPRDGWSAWQGRQVIAAAGVARPGRFFAMLRSHGLVVDELSLPDHFMFATLPWPAGDLDVIVTEKDAVKLDPAAARNARVWVAALDFVPDDAFASALLECLEPEGVPTDRPL